MPFLRQLLSHRIFTIWQPHFKFGYDMCGDTGEVGELRVKTKNEVPSSFCNNRFVWIHRPFKFVDETWPPEEY